MFIVYKDSRQTSRESTSSDEKQRHNCNPAFQGNLRCDHHWYRQAPNQNIHHRIRGWNHPVENEFNAGNAGGTPGYSEIPVTGYGAALENCNKDPGG